MSRNKIDVSGVLQNFAATSAKLIAHGGKNTVQIAQAKHEPYGLTLPERSLRHAVAVTRK
jgi:hypothetical protein